MPSSTNTAVMTAPLAIIIAGGQIIGKMKNIRVTENIQRGDVRGLGELLPKEKPALSWNGTLTCSFYTIDLVSTGLPQSVHRETGVVEEFVNSLLLQENGVDIYIYKKQATVSGIDATTGLVTEIENGDFAVIFGAFTDSQSFDISEGQISGMDQSFTYLNPILLPVS